MKIFGYKTILDRENRVSRLPVSTWSELVNKFFKLPVELNLTRHEFDAMSKQQRGKAKQAPYICPAIWPEDKYRRSYEGVCGVSFIALDLDDPQQASRIVNNVDSVINLLHPYNFVIHHTASSREDAPKIHLFVQAGDIHPSPDNYAVAAATVAQMVGLDPSKVNSESKVMVQAMFQPVRFRGDSAKDHPLIAFRDDGRAFSQADLEELAEDDTLDKANSPRVSHDDDNLDYLVAPVDGVKPEDIRDALNHLNPDLVYHRWIEIAAAIKHQAQWFDDPDEGFEVFDEWSSKGDKYESRESALKKWENFKPNPHNKKPITIRTLFEYCKKEGWAGSSTQTSCYEATLRWIVNCQDPIILMDQGPIRIVGTPLLNVFQTESLAEAFSRRAEELGQRIKLSTIKDAIKKARSKRAVESLNAENKIPEWLRDIVHVGDINKFLDRRNRKFYTPDVFNMHFSKYLLPTEDDLIRAGYTPTPANLSKPLIKPQDYAINVARIPTVYTTVYKPNDNEVIINNFENWDAVNIYEPTYPTGSELGYDEAKGCWDLMTGSIMHPYERRVLTDYIAHIVQTGEKILWSVFIWGLPGIGKTTLFDFAAAALGPRNSKTVAASSLLKEFDDNLIGAQLVAIEELMLPERSRAHAMEKLKPFITNTEVEVEGKGVGRRPQYSPTCYMAFSNDRAALRIDDSDRRWFLIETKQRTREQVLRLDHFDRVRECIDSNADGIRYFFENWEISPDFNPRKGAPGTSFKTQMVETSKNAVEHLIDEIMESSEGLGLDEDIVVSNILLDKIRERSSDIRGYDITPQWLSRILLNRGYDHVKRMMVNGERYTIWRGPKAEMFSDTDIVEISRQIIEGYNVELP